MKDPSPALVYAGRTTSYGELDRAASRVAQALIGEGAKPRANIAHLDKSSDLFFELLFGCAKAGAVMVSVNWRLAAPEITHILNDDEGEILLVGEEYLPVVDKTQRSAPSSSRYARPWPLARSTAPGTPYNPTGKILKRELRKPYWGDKQRQVN